jgi:hypothetical protein
VLDRRHRSDPALALARARRIWVARRRWVGAWNWSGARGGWSRVWDWGEDLYAGGSGGAGRKTEESRLKGGAPTASFGDYEFGIAHAFFRWRDWRRTRGLGRCFAFIRVLGRCLLSYELGTSNYLLIFQLPKNK